MHRRTGEAAAHAQPRRVQDELLAERAGEQVDLERVALDAAVGAAARDPVGAKHALAQLGLARKGHEVLLDGGRVAAAAAEAQLAVAPALRMVEQALFELVDVVDDRHGERVGAHLKALVRLAAHVQEVAQQVRHRALGKVGEARADVGVLALDAHLPAHGAEEVARLVLAKRDVALEPRVGDALRRVPVGAAAAVLGELLKLARKALHAARVERAVRRVRGAPLRVAHVERVARARAARLVDVVRAVVEAVLLHAARVLALVLDAADGHRDLPQGRCNTVSIVARPAIT